MDGHTSVIKEKAGVDVEGDDPKDGGVSDDTQVLNGDVSMYIKIFMRD